MLLESSTCSPPDRYDEEVIKYIAYQLGVENVEIETSYRLGKRKSDIKMILKDKSKERIYLIMQNA